MAISRLMIPEHEIAALVLAEQTREEGVAQEARPEDVDAMIAGLMYDPGYWHVGTLLSRYSGRISGIQCFSPVIMDPGMRRDNGGFGLSKCHSIKAVGEIQG